MAELTRRSGARARVLARLMAGPATNVELSDIALRFGARIYELRKDGYDIRTEDRTAGGLVTYALVQKA